MAKKIEELLVVIGAKTDKLNTGLRNSEKKISGFQKSVSGLGATIVAAFGVREIARFTGETIKLAGIAEGVESAFSAIGNEKLLAGLRKATRGTVSDLELMKKAVQAKNFQIPIENLASLFEFARRRAKATGESVEYLTQSLVTGLGRKSVLVLDNLGISASQLREELNGVGLESSSVGEIAAAVGRIATKSFSSMGDDIETTAENTEELIASFQNLKVEIGEKLTPAANVLLKTLTDIVKRVGFNEEDFISGEVNDEIEKVKESIKDLDKQAAKGQVVQEINKARAGYVLLQNELEKIKSKRFIPYSEGMKEANENIRITNRNLKTQTELIDGLKKLFDDLGINVDDPKDEISKLTNPIIELKKEIKDLEGSKLKLGISEDDIKDINYQLYVLNEQLDKLSKFEPPDPIKFTPTEMDSDFEMDEDIMPDFNDPEMGFIEPIITQSMLAKDALTEMGNEFNNTAGMVQEFSNILISNFANAEKGWKGLASASVESAKEIGAAMISMAIKRAILNSELSMINPIAALAVAGIATAGIYALVNQIPKLADGGLVYGNSVVNVGEYAGAAGNPEVIAPLDKLKGMLGGGQRIKVEFGDLSVSNEKLAIAVYRGNESLQNIT